MIRALVQRMNPILVRGTEHPRMGLASLRQILLLAILLAGCSPGKDMIDERALQARLDDQSTHPPEKTAEFAPTPSRRPLTPEVSSFLLGPDDVVKISVLNKPDLDTVEPVRPDGKIAFFPGRRHTGRRSHGRTASRRNRQPTARQDGPVISARHSGRHPNKSLRTRGS